MIKDPVSEFLFIHQNEFLILMSIVLDKLTVPLVFAFLISIYIFSKLKLENRTKFFFKLIGIDIKKEIPKIRKKLLIGFLSLLLAIASIQFIKLVYPQDRPCAIDISIMLLNKSDCPDSSSFPSTHTASAAALVPYTIGTFLFIPSLLFYILVAFSRVYLGLHYLLDVLVASSVGFVWFYIVERFINGKSKERIASKASNVFRGFLHLFFGIFIIFILMLGSMYTLYPIHVALLLLTYILIFIFVLLHSIESSNTKSGFNIIEEILKFISVRDRFYGESIIWFILGAMILIGFTQDVTESIVGLYIVTIGDVASAAFSSPPKERSIFKNKNLVSYAAFVISTLPVLIVSGLSLFPILLLAALVESLDLKINDNFVLFVFLTLSFMFLV